MAAGGPSVPPGPAAAPPRGGPPGRGAPGGYGLFVVVVVAGYVVFSGVSLVASLKTHSRQTAQASASASGSSTAAASAVKPIAAAPSASSTPVADTVFAESDACLKQIKGNDWDGAKKTCEAGLESAKDPKVLRALHFNLAAIARHERHLDVATKEYLEALTYDYADEVRDALAQTSNWKAAERREDTTVTGKKNASATLFKQPGTRSEKVKSLAVGTAVKTVACVSTSKETWCSVVVEDDRGWIALSRLEISKKKDGDDKER